MIEDVIAALNDLKMIFQEKRDTFKGFCKTSSGENFVGWIEVQSHTLKKSTNGDGESHARDCELKPTTMVQEIVILTSFTKILKVNLGKYSCHSYPFQNSLPRMGSSAKYSHSLSPNLHTNSTCLSS